MMIKKQKNTIKGFRKV